MERSVESKLTIYFDEPFWVGVFEELDGGKLSVCKVTFGAEPTDAQVWEFTADCNSPHRSRRSKSKTPTTPNAVSGTRENRWNLRVSAQSHSRRCKSNMRKTKLSANERPASKEKPKNSGNSN